MMISMLRGTVVDKNENELVLMTESGIGFGLLCSVNTLSVLPVSGKECTLYTEMSVKEDGVDLFGFLSKEERDLFRRLTSVSGIGPKTALGVLGSMPMSDFRLAVLTEDTAILSRAPGIGKKTAQRIVLELKDKLAQDTMSLPASKDDAVSLPNNDTFAQDAVSEAILALKALGYTPQEAANAVKQVKEKAASVDELIKLALRQMVQMG